VAVFVIIFHTSTIYRVALLERAECNTITGRMPRQSQTGDAAGIKDTTLVIDNGGYTIKAGLIVTSAAPDLQDCRIIPNCIARDSDKKVWIASQLEQCRDFREMAFRRPVDKGYLVNWEGEKAIWGQSFFSPTSELKVKQGCVDFSW
jgi:actin-related protein 6